MNSTKSKHIPKHLIPPQKTLLPALILAFKRLRPNYLIKNPVIFVTYIGCIFLTIFFICTFLMTNNEPKYFIFQILVWLWFTVIFSNFSECLAERRGKARAESLKKERHEIQAKKIKNVYDRKYHIIPAPLLQRDDLVLVEAGDIIPGDGEVIEGVAAVNESAITGESAPVIRERGEDRNSVTGGTTVLSDWIIIRITVNPGETFLDQMISLVEGAKRQRTPNEIALGILLAAMSLIFLIVVTTLLPFSIFSIKQIGQGEGISLTGLISLLICLIPTTIGGLLSAIGIAGMDRLIRCNVIASSGKAVEGAGDVNILLLDKTGTLTLGNRQAVAFYPAKGVSIQDLVEAATLSSLADETPEGKSIIQLAKNKYQIQPRDLQTLNPIFIPFSAESRMSGIEFNGTKILKGSIDKIVLHVQKQNGIVDNDIIKKVEDISRTGSTPLLLVKNEKILGAVELKDVIKPGIKQRLAELRLMGIKSIMVTGDNPLTAATIANEVGVDDFYPEFTPELKLQLIRKMQENGHLIAMVGDGTNDAPALAQTDVAVAMNSGTQAAKEAANMIDLDSDPTKLLEIVKVGKQLLMTRGVLTTFSIANDLAKYFAIIPAAFSSLVPGLQHFNIMSLESPLSAILSTVIFNALIIIFLIPLALKGIHIKAKSTSKLLFQNIVIYGFGGMIIPFLGIKLIDMFINRIHLI